MIKPFSIDGFLKKIEKDVDDGCAVMGNPNFKNEYPDIEKLSDLSNLKKINIIKILRELGAQGFWSFEILRKQFFEVGINIQLNSFDNSITFFGKPIYLRQAEWGDDGYYAPDFLSILISELNFVIDTRMTGRGFRHEDLLNKLAEKWISN